MLIKLFTTLNLLCFLANKLNISYPLLVEFVILDLLGEEAKLLQLQQVSTG